MSKEEALDKKADVLEKKEAKLNEKDAELDKQKKELAEIKNSHLKELEKISGLTTEQAKEYLLKSVEEDVKHETAVLVKELERKAKEEADKKGKRLCCYSNSALCSRSGCRKHNHCGSAA